MATDAELNGNTSANAMSMAEAMSGSGVTVVGASYTGPRDSSATFAKGHLPPGVLDSSSGRGDNNSQFTSSEGLATESFLAGPQSTRMFESGIIEEIRTLFPGRNPQTGGGYSPVVRRALQPYKAQLLFAAAERAA